MAISQALLPEFDMEMANTRKTLERIPENKFGWKPHEKSMELGRLASHLAELPGWTEHTLTQESIDINPPGGQQFEAANLSSRKEVLDLFDKNVASARAAIAGASDAEFMKPWSLLNGGTVVFTLPKAAVLRSFVLSHSIHHRAQLGVYLRLNDVPVPSIYGPSADESAF
jgi:uncharacterized damage-inducible protein DinB